MDAIPSELSEGDQDSSRQRRAVDDTDEYGTTSLSGVVVEEFEDGTLPAKIGHADRNMNNIEGNALLLEQPRVSKVDKLDNIDFQDSN